MTIRLLATAEADLKNIFGWYEEIEEGLGHRFTLTFDKSTKIIAAFPRGFREVKKDIFFYVMETFPYNILFSLDMKRSEVIVISIVHQLRHPEVGFRG